MSKKRHGELWNYFSHRKSAKNSGVLDPRKFMSAKNSKTDHVCKIFMAVEKKIEKPYCFISILLYLFPYFWKIH